MFDFLIKPTIQISTNIIEEAKKILNEKKPNEFTDEDVLILELAFNLLQISKEEIKW